MSTRRPLGTGPSTTTPRSTTPIPAPRLLPAERIEPGALLGTPVDAEPTALQDGRRVLGTGPKSGPTDS